MNECGVSDAIKIPTKCYVFKFESAEDSKGASSRPFNGKLDEKSRSTSEITRMIGPSWLDVKRGGSWPNGRRFENNEKAESLVLEEDYCGCNKQVRRMNKVFRIGNNFGEQVGRGLEPGTQRRNRTNRVDLARTHSERNGERAILA